VRKKKMHARGWGMVVGVMELATGAAVVMVVVVCIRIKMAE